MNEAQGRSLTPRAFERLVRSVSHDYNNLFTILAGNLGLLTGEHPLPASSRWELVADCRDALEQAQAVNVTFRSSLVANGEALPPCTDRFDAVEQTLRVVELCQRAFPPDVAITVRRSVDRAPSMGDPLGFRTAVYNLLLNARDALCRGGRVEVSVDSVDAGWAIRVIDNGAGIDPAHLDQVMDSFFTTRHEQGRPGIGLHQVRLFALESEGRIELDSEPGRGTTARLWLQSVEDSESSPGTVD